MAEQALFSSDSLKDSGASANDATAAFLKELSNVFQDTRDQLTGGNPWVTQGNRAERAGNPAKALEFYAGDLLQVDKELSTWGDYYKKSPNRYDAPLVSAHGNVARCLEQLGKPDEARKHYEAILETYKKQYGYSENYSGKWDTSVINCRRNIARCLEAEEKFGEAVAQQSAVQSIYKRQFDYRDYSACPYDRGLVESHRDAARCLQKLGKDSEALLEQKEVLKIYKRQPDYRDWTQSPLDEGLVRTYRDIALLESGRGNHQEALANQQEVLKIYQRQNSYRPWRDCPQNTGLARYHADMSSILSRQDKLDEAIQHRKEELKLYQGQDDYRSFSPCPYDSRLDACYKSLALMYARQGKMEESISYRQAGLQLLEKQEKAPAAQIASGYEALGGEWEKLGKNEPAVLEYKKALGKLQLPDGTTTGDVTALRKKLATCLEKLGKNIDVEEAREEKADFERRDGLEKIPFLMARLPRHLEIKHENGETRIESNDFLKLMQAAPGTRIEHGLKEVLTASGSNAALADKQAAGAMDLLNGIKSIRVGKEHIEISRDRQSSIPYDFSIPGIGGLSDVTFGKKIAFDMTCRQENPASIDLKNIEGMKVTFSGGSQAEITSLSIKQEQSADKKWNQYLSLAIKKPEQCPFPSLQFGWKLVADPIALKVPLAENLSPQAAEGFAKRCQQLNLLGSALAQGDYAAVLQTLTGNLKPPVRDLLSSITAVSRHGDYLEASRSRSARYKMSDLCGSGLGNDDPTIELGEKLSFRLSPAHFAFDLEGLSGAHLSIPGAIPKALRCGDRLETNLTGLYLGGRDSDGSRHLSLQTDNGIHWLSMDLGADLSPKPNSRALVQIDNPVGAAGKKNILSFKFDANSQPDVSFGEAAYIVLDGIDSRVSKFLDHLLP